MNRLPVAERREQLIDAAIRVASRDGIDAATVRAIASEAGVSLGVVHYCFRDKDEILRSMAHYITRQNLTTGLQQMPPEGEAAEIILGATHLLWSNIAQTRGAQLLSFELTTYSMRHPEVRQVSAEQYSVSHEAARTFLESVARAAHVEWTLPLAQLARLVVMATDGITLAWLADHDGDQALSALEVFGSFLACHIRPAQRGADALEQPFADQPA